MTFLIYKHNPEFDQLKETMDLMIFMLVFYSILFVADLLTIIYFINMANRYTRILSNHFEINRKYFFSAATLLTIWVLITLFRFEIFYNLMELVAAI